MIRTPPPLAVLAVAGHLLVPVSGHAQQVPEWLLRLKLPNSAAKSIMTPSAWGAAFGSAYIGVGGADRSPYLPSTDAVVGLGYGMGDPVLGIGLQIGTTISDLSEFDNVSVSFKLHQYLAKGTAFAFGGESLFSNNALADDAGNTFYLVVSHVLQALGSRRQGVGSVHVSAGVGTGRFARKSARDFSEGKGRNGTLVFGNLALEVIRDVMVTLEWSGTNLYAGMSTTIRVLQVPISLSAALADLTGYSGDGVRFISAAGLALPL